MEWLAKQYLRLWIEIMCLDIDSVRDKDIYCALCGGKGHRSPDCPWVKI